MLSSLKKKNLLNDIIFNCLFSTAELKMEILRERELRESIEKQLMEDQRNRGELLSQTISFKFDCPIIQYDKSIQIKTRYYTWLINWKGWNNKK